MRLIVVGQLAQGGMLAGNERKKRRAVASTRSMLSTQAQAAPIINTNGGSVQATAAEAL